MSNYLLSSTVLLLLVTDPLGCFPAYVALLRQVPSERKTRVIVREVAVAFVLLLLFSVFGSQLLAVMQLSETSVAIAGGVVLLMIALRIIFPHPEGAMGELSEGEPFIVPLAIPLIAGPSTLATVMVLVARDPDKLGQLVLALTITMSLVMLALFSAEKVSGFFGPQVTKAFERLMGLILTAIAVEMILSGVERYLLHIQQVLKP